MKNKFFCIVTAITLLFSGCGSEKKISTEATEETIVETSAATNVETMETVEETEESIAETMESQQESEETNSSEEATDVIEEQVWSENILPMMTDGLEDSLLKSLYEKEFTDLASLSSVAPKVYHYSIDLNQDGMDDEIVVLRSMLHSSAGGDTFEIWLSKDGSYEKVASEILYIMNADDDSFLGEMMIEESGHQVHSIQHVDEGQVALFTYDGTAYVTD